jgi:hypothetical protein
MHEHSGRCRLQYGLSACIGPSSIASDDTLCRSFDTDLLSDNSTRYRKAMVQAVEAAHKAYTSVKESKTIASLPSHISRAKAASSVWDETEQLVRSNILRSETLLKDALKFPLPQQDEPKTSNGAQKDSTSQQSTCARPDAPAKKEGCYTLDQLYLPILALCLLSCASGWLLRERLTFPESNKDNLQGKTIKASSAE